MQRRHIKQSTLLFLDSENTLALTYTQHPHQSVSGQWEYSAQWNQYKCTQFLTHRTEEECVSVCVCCWWKQGKWLLLSPLCYVTLQSNYRVCALFRGCLIMLFWLCRALGCLCVCECVCIHEKMLIAEVVFFWYSNCQREKREGRRTNLSGALWPFC